MNGHRARLSKLAMATVLVCTLAACGKESATPPAAANAPSSTRVPPRPSPTPIPPPQSWLRHTTILTMYGRAFGVAPILGRLGMDSNFADLSAQVRPFIQGVRANDGGKQIRVAVHLIYAIATPCRDSANCLEYLDDTGVNIVKQYIEPAARRGWLVILDDQLGSSNPAAEMSRMIRKGYLRYDNVEVALDPEFRATSGQATPGIPVGSVQASEINQAQRLLSRYAAPFHLHHRKIVLVHQFQDFMIGQRGRLRVHVPDIDVVVVADGFGTPGIKAHVYSALLGPPVSRRLPWRGIKLFYPNPNESAGHGDSPLMTWSQVFGHAPAIDSDGKRYFVRPAPSIVVVA